MSKYTLPGSISSQVVPAYVALSAHVTVGDQSLSQAAAVMAALKAMLHERFEIHHTTIEGFISQFR